MNNKTPKTPASESVAPALTEFDFGGIRRPSAEFAGDLIVNAAKWVEAIVNDKDVPSTVIASPVLVGAHAMTALLDFELGRIVPILERGCTALEEIAEQMKRINFRPDNACEVPTDEERMIFYLALKADYMKRVNEVGSICIIAEGGMDERAALLRFKKLAGL